MNLDWATLILGYLGITTWVCIALVEDLVLASKYLDLLALSVIVPFQQIPAFQLLSTFKFSRFNKFTCYI